jgi:hypothetical protein
MSKGWKDDKAWSDQYIPTIKAICGLYLIGEATVIEDQERNTDLMMNGLRIAVRLRKWDSWPKRSRRGEFTMRTARPRGAPTEFQKVLDGWGDYFFYGFAHQSAPKLYGFGLLHLGHFRDWLTQHQTLHATWPGFIQRNHDRSSDFRVFRWVDLPPIAILATFPHDVAEGIAIATDDLRRAVQLALEYTQDIP